MKTNQVGSSDSPTEKLDLNREHIVEDLRELADMLAERNMRLAYENWCWSTHAPTWRDVWEIVKAVDRPNIGLCLDTFQTAGSEWGDPTNASGLMEDCSIDDLKVRFKESLADQASSIPPEKIYLLQISDAYRVPEPLERKVINDLLPRGRWSHDWRPQPYDGGYLPVEEVTKAVLRTGFRGWFSLEVFDYGPDGKGKDIDMITYARSGMQNMRRLFNFCATDQ